MVRRFDASSTDPHRAPSSQRNASSWRAYAMALAAVSLAAAIRWALDPLLADRLTFTPFFGAVALAVWFGGWRSGGVAAACGFLVAEYLFIEPRFSFALDQLFAVGAFAG
jgi:K+-sensing histidine kinase KdpD